MNAPDYHYPIKLLYMSVGMDDYFDGIWRMDILPANSEIRSYYAAGWAMALNSNLSLINDEPLYGRIIP